jgi:hypothetical protein
MTRRIISLIVICGAIGTAAILPPGQAAAADGTSPVAGKPPAPAGLRVGFMAYYTPETELVINAAGIENHRRVEAACASLHPLSFTQGGAAAVPERSRVALEKGDVDALLICTWASYPPRWYARVGETSSLSELAALGAKNNPEFRILWHAFMMPNHDKPADKDSKPALNLKSTRESLIAGRKQLEAEVDGVNERLGRRVACIVPVADAGLALVDKVVAGEVPGVTSVEELFAEPGSSPPWPRTATTPRSIEPRRRDLSCRSRSSRRSPRVRRRRSTSGRSRPPRTRSCRRSPGRRCRSIRTRASPPGSDCRQQSGRCGGAAGRAVSAFRASVLP